MITLIERLEFERIDLKEKLNSYEYKKVDMDGNIKEVISEHQNLLSKIKFLAFKFHIVLENNKSLILN